MNVEMGGEAKSEYYIVSVSIDKIWEHEFCTSFNLFSHTHLPMMCYQDINISKWSRSRRGAHLLLAIGEIVKSVSTSVFCYFLFLPLTDL